MFRRIDQAPSLARFLENLSATLAKRRGLPIVIGVILVAISFVISLINVYSHSQTLDLLWTITHHLGLLFALIGLLMVEPLGQ
ncbi:MAG TPA: hypothetical protein VHD90_05880 [Phototrophicaceae bacterium]|nr:hypothetical protein [Phototrophicaceae bacterium]